MTQMIDPSYQTKQPQTTFIHYVLKLALEEINTLSDSIVAVQPTEYEVEKDTLVRLAFLIHEKIRDVRGLIDEMTKENRSFGLD